jgi:diguanylate cyclase (GGDEF)-like protein/PAS domain S-box-containing protein
MFVNIDNKEKFFTYLQALPVAVVIADTVTGEIVFFSKEAESLWKRDANEVVGKNQTVLHPAYWNEKERETFSKDIAVLRSGNIVKNTKNAILCGDGREVPVDIYASLVEIEGKEYILGVFISIEKRINALNELQQKNSSLEYLLENIGGISWEYDAVNDFFVYISKNIENILGYNAAMLSNFDAFYKLVHPQDREKVFFSIRRKKFARVNNILEFRIKKRDGSYIWVLNIINVKKDSSGNIIQFYGFIIDITSQKEMQLALKKEKEFVSSVINAIDDSILVIGLDCSVKMMNHKAQMALESRGKRVSSTLKCYDVFHNTFNQCAVDEHKCPMSRVLETKEIVKTIHLHKMENGEERYIEISATPLFNEAGEIDSIIEIGHDITEHIALLRELEKNTDLLDFKAHHDDLTKLPNRTLYRDRLEMAIKKAERSGEKFTVMFLDLDHFKAVNDSLGHAAGDKVLIEATQRLKSIIRAEDTLARLGGDEFSILLEGIKDTQSVSRLAQKILDIFQEPFEIDGNSVYIGCSIGIALYPDDGREAEDLLKFADNAMYKAKEKGRNSFEFYTKSMTMQANRRIELEREIRAALKNDEFFLQYQPQVDAKTKKVAGVEALIRWNHPTKGEIPPHEFIRFAQQSKLIVEIDNWVMQQALSDVSQWYSEGIFDGKLSLNLATKQLENSEFVNFLQQQLQKFHFDANNLVLEILENDTMKNPQRSIERLNRLKSLNLSLALDDFGTGYSSLTYLYKFPIDELKLDRTFVVAAQQGNPEIALAVIALAKALGLELIAEGIETEEDLNFMLEHGCYLIQGYYYSKPLCNEDMKEFLKRGIQ